MTQERADEIVRKVIYARLKVMPKMENSDDAFHVGRMVGQMQRQLEIELSSEVESREKEAEECPMQAFYEMKADECKAHNGNCKECNMGCDIEEDEEEE